MEGRVKKYGGGYIRSGWGGWGMGRQGYVSDNYSINGGGKEKGGEGGGGGSGGIVCGGWGGGEGGRG